MDHPGPEATGCSACLCSASCCCFSFCLEPWPTNLTCHRCYCPLAGSQAGFLSCWRRSGAATLGEGWRVTRVCTPNATQEEWEGFLNWRRHRNALRSLWPEEPLARRGWEWGVSGSAVASPSEVACPRVGCLQLMCGALYEQLGCETGLLIVCWKG